MSLTAKTMFFDYASDVRATNFFNVSMTLMAYVMIEKKNSVRKEVRSFFKPASRMTVYIYTIDSGLTLVTRSRARARVQIRDQIE